MYSPGNSVIVNLCMRFPVMAAIAAGCILAARELPKNEPPPPVVVAPAAKVTLPPPLEEVHPTAKPIEFTCPKGLKVHIVNGQKRCVRG